MSGPLTIDKAIELARALSTIPDFPRFPEAIQATADDLMRWCTGAIVDQQMWSSEAQANWTVTEARETWPTWLGTSELHNLFKSKFRPQSKTSNTFIDYSNEPCVCGSGKKFKNCCQPEHLMRLRRDGPA